MALLAGVFAATFAFCSPFSDAFRRVPLSATRQAILRTPATSEAVLMSAATESGEDAPATAELMLTTVRNDASGADARRGIFRFTSETPGVGVGRDATMLENVKQVGDDLFQGTMITEDELKRRIVAESRKLMFFIHGFNVQSGGMLGSSKDMQEEFDKNRAQEVLVVPVHWACGDRLGILRDYDSDQRVAVTTADAVSRLFLEDSELLPKLKEKGLNVVAHSMGNRVLRFVGKKTAPSSEWDLVKLDDASASLHDAAPEGLRARQSLFDNIFLVAADVPCDVMEEDEAIESGFASLSVLAEKLHVLHAFDDLALQASRGVNRSPRRLGTSGPTRMWSKMNNVAVHNCNRWNGKKDWLIGHGYQAVPQVVDYYLRHM
uniref:DUF676 domain-containing protein n=1 Tax=Chromera velia CCMP2878 TaxID=1169474 RepID=A0A0G4HJY4_9ALVE|eukprot:Cvel_7207.t1-p1 / transcript=Cvel_7207.t1 / gene=Cvel_7207 / organism=Chromera_velia_CCMP2878 / gene_product=hypothetical protein / transcript_product=hypothetical protein / location=Cvel_scaffold371:32621-33903(-) / protein_length=376 / sequence_SO=supercontig / SO=protein_coding / is_pseudo=false